MKRSLLILVLGIVLILPCCNNSDKKEEIYVLHAGSLSIPFREMAEKFMDRYPNTVVKLEAHGSRTCARQISDLNRRADVMGSADSAVIRNLLIPDFAEFCIDFATNEMAIMYNKKSKYSDTINSNNWYEILLKPDIQYGHSDPSSDPCGYRTILTWQLAEKYYKVPGLFEKLTKKMSKKNIRSKEVDLIAMLETYELDYIFIYRSVAEQHNSKYVLLPDEVNLKSKNLAEFYRTASIKISGKKPDEWINKRGAPMIYGITLPKNAKNPEWAAKFIEFILSKDGQKIMAKNGQPGIIPPRVDFYEKLPEALKRFFKNEI